MCDRDQIESKTMASKNDDSATFKPDDIKSITRM